MCCFIGIDSATLIILLSYQYTNERMIQDTSAQDVTIDKPKFHFTLKWVSIIALAVSFLILILNAVLNWSSSARSVDRSRIRIATVERGHFIRDIALNGVIIAANSPKLYAPAVGNVTLKVNPGELVTKNQLLAVVSSPELTNRLMQEQSKLESLGFALQKMKIQAKKANIEARQKIELEEVILAAANREMRRAKQSIKIKAISQLDFEKAVDDLKSSELKHKFAIEQSKLEQENLAFELKTTEFELNQYRLQVDNTTRLVNSLNMLAPVNGIVGSWSVEQKAAVILNQPILTIVDLSKFQVEVDIPQSYANSIGIGMLVNITYNNKIFEASVITISPEVTNNVVKARVDFTSSPPPGIKQNQRVSSRVILEERENVLFLPRGSFTQHHGGRKIFVIRNNLATLTDIKLGSSSIKKIEIVAGLNEGDQVIVSNTDFVGKVERLNLN